MRLWKYERNRAGEQTLTLVDDAAEPADSDRQAALDKAAIETPVAAKPAVERPGVERPAAERPAAMDIASNAIAKSIEDGMRAERAEIIRRVNAFRDLQLRVKRDREQYCDAVLAKTFAALGHQTKPLR